MSPLPTVLVVDDRPNMLRLLQKVLKHDARVLLAGGGREALGVLEREPVSVVLADLRMPDVDGLAVLKECKRLRPGAEFILMTAYATVPNAVEALRAGAYDYLTKPFDPALARAVVLRALGRAASAPDAGASGDDAELLPGLVGRSPAMHELAELVRRFARSDATVLLLGETGTGKELVARALHRLGARAERRFVAVNSAAIPGELLESELFGYARGAFTGAARDRAGLFEDADKGTLFLDEIGELRVSLQAKLTRALEERAVRRIGEARERPVDVRLIAATHRDVGAMVAAGTFREDLWYRLNVATVRLPPLRERADDVALLAARFLRESSASAPGRRVSGFSDAALESMRRFEWPGNVRQLRAAVERACLVATGERIEPEDLPPELARPATAPAASDLAAMPWSEAIETARADVARRYLEEVLRRHGGRVADAASHAGVERESFYRLMRRYGVEAAEPPAHDS
ncbi:MAG: sigma-54 dependent transcriptional regulator [Sorangiineae bacterium]|nr:sigma-54 dependent transcriptional regulator [Polyangiaceae bacterium]MEB2323745.1 sigma-54 dependent transcriptional regulator [Sorangiineae bacterium]